MSKAISFFLILQFFYCFHSCKNTALTSNTYDHEEGHGFYVPHPIYPDVMLDSSAILLKESYFIPLTDPIWYPASDAYYMQANDDVLGILIDSAAYAFPWWIMKNHHIANIHLHDKPIVITLCEMCSGNAGFYTQVDTMKLTFWQEGLYHGTWFMRDSETNSYWTPFDGYCFAGPLKGKELKPIESFQTKWETWKKQYPETKVLYESENMRQGHGSFEFPGSKRIAKDFEKSFRVPLEKISDPFDIILGVKQGLFTKAYPFRELDVTASPVLMDSIDLEKRIVIFYELNTTMAGAYNPDISDEYHLHFNFENNQIVDTETKSVWTKNGLCFSGKLKGEKLSPYYFTTKEKYGWVNMYPHTSIYQKIKN